MTNEPKKWGIIFIGPPGSGKDTQAELLARELKLTELRTSKIIEDKLASADENDPVMSKEKELKRSGQLNTSELVEAWLFERIEEIGKKGEGFIGNGWPRQIEEARAEMPFLEKFYPKDSLKIVYITLSEEETIRRNSKRRVCQQNGHPIPDTEANKDLTACPEDGSPIILRTDDAPETIIKRYRIYQSETQPVIDFLEKQGYNIITIDGERSIEDVHRDILVKLW